MKTLITISGIVLFAASSITTSSSAVEFSKRIPDKLETSSNSTVHTSLRVKDCWEPKGFLSKHFDIQEYTRECAGQGGWRLFYAATSERSWLEIAKGKRLWSTRYEVTGSAEHGFGQMQDLGEVGSVEWRLDSGNPVALIFKVQATDPNSTNQKIRILHRYYVLGLSKGIPQFCGSVKSKIEARKIAEALTNCLNLEELSKVGDR